MLLIHDISIIKVIQANEISLRGISEGVVSPMKKVNIFKFMGIPVFTQQPLLYFQRGLKYKLIFCMS